MSSQFSFVIERAFSGTVSIILSVFLLSFVFVMLFMWISVPFVLLSIRKELKSIREQLGSLLRNDS